MVCHNEAQLVNKDNIVYIPPNKRAIHNKNSENISVFENH